MAPKYFISAISILCLMGAPALAEPQEMSDDALALVVGGDNGTTLSSPSGGVIKADDGNVTIVETGNVSLSVEAQRLATGLEVFNSAHSNIGSGVNIAVITSGEDVSSVVTTANDSNLSLFQDNTIDLNSSQSASAGSLTNYTTETTGGLMTSDNTSSTASVSTGAIDVNIIDVIEVSAPTGSGLAMAGDATLNVQSFELDINGDVTISGPSLDMDIEGAGCYVTGGNCAASQDKDILSAPAVAATNVVEATGTGLTGEVISLGDGVGVVDSSGSASGVISVTKENTVSLSGNAQQEATGLKLLNASSSVFGSGVNISVNRCCRVNFTNATRGVDQLNVVNARF